jgi:hypothetical protein
MTTSLTPVYGSMLSIDGVLIRSRTYWHGCQDVYECRVYVRPFANVPTGTPVAAGEMASQHPANHAD